MELLNRSNSARKSGKCTKKRNLKSFDKSGGTVEQWNSGTVEQWNSGTVEQWNSGTVEQ